nr:nuclear transport factor 2 family protein [Massilia antarctica]
MQVLACAIRAASWPSSSVAGVIGDSGVYTFDVVKDGKPAKVQARYTFVYKKLGKEWLILKHHSSAMPEQVALH